MKQGHRRHSWAAAMTGPRSSQHHSSLTLFDWTTFLCHGLLVGAFMEGLALHPHLASPLQRERGERGGLCLKAHTIAR